MKFRELTDGRLAEVMLRTRALRPRDLSVVEGDLVKDARGHRGEAWADKLVGEGYFDLAAYFVEVLDLPRVERRNFVTALTRVLDDLLAQDFFGTEGQLDPRGDHRD